MKYLIALIALLLPTYLIRFSIFGIPTTLLELVIYAVFLYGLFNLGYSQWLKVKRRVWLPIVLLIMGLIVSFYITPDKREALGQLKAFFVDPLLVFWLMLAYLEEKDFRWIVYGFAGSGLFVSVHTVVQKILGHITSDGRVIGVFGYSPNYLALFLAPIAVLTLCYALALSLKKSWLSYVFYAVSLISLIAIYFSGSRAGLLAVAGGVGFYLVILFWEFFKKKVWRKIALVTLVVVALAISWFFFKPNFSVSQTDGGRTASSNNIRWEIWKGSIELIKGNPILGVGLTNFQNAFGIFTQNRVNFPEFITPLALTPHNIFLTFYLETSIFGLIAFLWLLVTFYKVGFEAKSKTAMILLAVMTGLILQGLVDTPYFKNDLAVFFWLIFGIMIVLTKKETFPEK